MNLRPCIGIDVDGVVANLHEPWIQWLREFDYNIEQHPGFTHWSHPLDLAGKFALDFIHKRIYDQDIVKPFEGALAAIEMFRDLGYGICFVSDCINDTAQAKLSWLHRWGFLKVGASYTQFIPTSNKSNVPVYMLVDDHVDNVASFKGIGVLHTRSHNRQSAWNGLRIGHLAELYPFIR
jgi:5'(3')-deoxyribonucleotidase